jgi:putative ABC transport system ATP-binding protein
MDILKEVNDQGITVIIVTHEHDIAALTRKIIRLKDGIIGEVITNGELQMYRDRVKQE